MRPLKHKGCEELCSRSAAELRRGRQSSRDSQNNALATGL